ncbi:MAG: glutamate 5-kinase [Thermodesulfobacteriota bacterium]|nr:glutamate 5-kinase [Thermodesulfobacteriota bacterium]
MTPRAIINKVHRIVLKVGSQVLTAKGRSLNQAIFDRLAKEVSAAKKKGFEVVIVSSGAIAAGMSRLGLTEKPKTIPQKQASAAIGQSALMWNYERAFTFYGEKVAQVLLTRDDLSNRNRYLNARNTLLTLLDFGVIPIINENDTVVVEEIKFGDNDNLSALVTNLVNADLLVVLSDIDGLYDRDPRLHKNAKLIPLVPQVTVEMEMKASGTLSPISIGGMVTKLQAARKAALFGVPTILANGTVDGIIEKILRGEEVGTLFASEVNKLNSRKHWIAFTLKARGKIIVDEGAKKAILQKGKSLLPSGVLGAEGKFGPSDPVVLTDTQGQDFAKGLSNYTSSEINKIKGLKTTEIEIKLGYKYSDEIVHRDDLVVL